MGRDGCIYAFSLYSGVLKIDKVNNSHRSVGGNMINSFDGDDSILGIDGCIYCPTGFGSRIWIYDPILNHTCMGGDDFGDSGN